MELKLAMRLDNAAFEDNRPEEIARILRRLADYVEGYWGDFKYNEGSTLMDVNGNRIGKVDLIGANDD